ncbi:hypothetical protein MtrunA17_Chr2g0281471 [Medicago truncatula]|uniref:Uncharacterized protein n=1 Tax=Medicago truncatula TaxID=3880 RepID=A0A396J590_MEDTR|nr:hypothetical protein MtrunA17_Chr2g0281471 [Medicago truncatula]
MAFQSHIIFLLPPFQLLLISNFKFSPKFSLHRLSVSSTLSLFLFLLQVI